MTDSYIPPPTTAQPPRVDGTIPVDDTTTLSLLYHINSEPWLNDAAYEQAAGHEPVIDPGDGPVTVLPPAEHSPLVRLQASRVSCRSFSAQQMPLSTVASLLAGVQGIVGSTASSFLRRATPSAGGLFPLQLHLFARRIAGLPEGRFQYLPLEHALLEFERMDVSDALAAALYAYPFVANANAVTAFVAQFGRQQEKYGPRGYRYILLEAGHCAQNLCLRAAELGLSTLCIGGFADTAINQILGLDPTRAGVVYMVAFGYSAEAP